MKNIKSQTKQIRLGILLFLLIVLALSFSVTFAYFTGSFKVKGETRFGNVDVSFHDAEKEITNSNFANVFMPEALVPGAPIDFSELRVKNESNTDIYTLLEFKATISNSDSSQVETYTTWYNLAGEKVNISNIDKEASKIAIGSSGQASTLTYTVPTDIGNIYKNGKLKIDITTHAIQGSFNEALGNEPLYASFLILKATDETITSPLVELKLKIDNSNPVVYRVKKNTSLQNAITETNTTANDYNSCGWFDDNEYLDCTDLTQNITTNKTLYTKTATLDKLCFRNKGTYYSVGGRLANGTTYMEDDATGKVATDFVTDTTISGEVVFPCRYKNSAGLDLPVTHIHNLALDYFTDYGKFPFRDTQVSSFVISTSITNMSYKSFGYCEKLTKLFIHDRVTFVYNNCIDACLNVDQIKVSVKNDNYYDVDNTFLVSKGKSLISCIYAGIEDVVIPEDVVDIGQHVFDRVEFKSVTIPDSVKSIQSWCTLDSSIENINISRTSNLTKIGTSSFSKSIRLVSFYIPSKVTSISNDAFLYCTALKTVTVDSPTIYNALTGTEEETCGGLIRYATTINVLKSVVDDANNSNSFLNDTTKYTKTSTTIDGYDYYQYTKK